MIFYSIDCSKEKDILEFGYFGNMALQMIKAFFFSSENEKDKNVNSKCDCSNKKSNCVADEKSDSQKYLDLVKASRGGLLEKKKEYAKNLGDWIESYVKKNLKSKAITAAKKGYTKFVLCEIPRAQTNWHGKYLWRFAISELKGWKSEYLINQENYPNNEFYYGPFFNAEVYLKEKCREISQSIPFTLTYKLERDDKFDGFQLISFYEFYTIVATLKQ